MTSVAPSQLAPHEWIGSILPGPFIPTDAWPFERQLLLRGRVPAVAWRPLLYWLTRR